MIKVILQMEKGNYAKKPVLQEKPASFDLMFDSQVTISQDFKGRAAEFFGKDSSGRGSHA